VVDGHNFHVTLEVVHKARGVGLDLLTLLSYTSHHLQPLNVSIFGPFKKAFKRYRDAWTMQNIERGVSKKVLAQWVSKALYKALIESNIWSGFRATGIWPLNAQAVNQYMQPFVQFIQTNLAHDENEDTDDNREEGNNMEADDQGSNNHT
jgi:hypothetical protein